MPGFYVMTFGCQMNSHDSDRMGEVLRGAGYDEMASPGEADVVLLNTCSVREKAEQKLRSEIGRLAELKRKRPNLVLGVAGCVAQQEGARLLRTMPHVNLVIGPDNIAELPALLADAEPGHQVVRTVFDLDEPRFLNADPAFGKASATAFVTTMKGCNERCSFCIVPTTRGPERYRSSREILAEVRRLVAAGVKEVTLLGQTVNSYRDPERALEPLPKEAEEHPTWHRSPGDETEFPALLRAIAEHVPELSRLRYTSPHPRHLTPALARAHAELPVLCQHVHMPFQSGSDRVLKRMIRRYTIEEYVERVNLLTERLPGLTLSTDAIVGFPGETRDDFMKTLELIERVRFVGVYGFKYSQRPGTPALKLSDDVTEDEKAERLAELFSVADEIRHTHLSNLVGTKATVLVEGPGKSTGFTGRTERNEIVHFEAPGDPTGQLVDVEIRRAFRNSLEAVPLGTLPARSACAPRRAERRALPLV
jgi:tRNA-2-methylthio-N6-dimethylallyladenosine synthase